MLQMRRRQVFYPLLVAIDDTCYIMFAAIPTPLFACLESRRRAG